MESFEIHLKDISKFYQNFNKFTLQFIKSQQQSLQALTSLAEQIGIFTSSNSALNLKSHLQSLQQLIQTFSNGTLNLVASLQPVLSASNLLDDIKMIQNALKASKMAKIPFIQQANTDFLIAAGDFERKRYKNSKIIVKNFGIGILKFSAPILEKSSGISQISDEIDEIDGILGISQRFQGFDCGKETVDILGVRGRQYGTGTQRFQSKDISKGQTSGKKKQLSTQKRNKSPIQVYGGTVATSPSQTSGQIGSQKQVKQDDFIQIIPMSQSAQQQTSYLQQQQYVQVGGQVNSQEQDQVQEQVQTKQQIQSTVQYSPQNAVYKKKQPRSCNYKFEESTIEDEIRAEVYQDNLILLDVPSPGKLKTPEDIQRQLDALSVLEKYLLANQSISTHQQLSQHVQGTYHLQKQALTNQQSSFTQDHQGLSVSAPDPMFYQQQLSAIQQQINTIPSIQSLNDPSQLQNTQQPQQQNPSQEQLMKQLTELQTQINQQAKSPIQQQISIVQPICLDNSQSSSILKNNSIKEQLVTQPEPEQIQRPVSERSDTEPSKTSNSSNSKKGFFKQSETKKETKKFDLYGDDEIEDNKKTKNPIKKSILPNIDIDIPELESQASNVNKKVNLDAFF
ncbi:hypothetical protein SS50377_25428 [Spironucleus salmonicida]|uniref:Uncharacterized protein n=1 Tax=Spironucleus salmonicida TaxID=348837 RepID=V6LVX7_9EUKA|nr:hypothetical protein SS50377_25428 [Spironucleus salmonicida]|eukprot:EST44974.1 hypothetical protein SS50377_14993 [Spironucleus salmonicida]